MRPQSPQLPATAACCAAAARCKARLVARPLAPVRQRARPARSAFLRARRFDRTSSLRSRTPSGQTHRAVQVGAAPTAAALAFHDRAVRARTRRLPCPAVGLARQHGLSGGPGASAARRSVSAQARQGQTLHKSPACQPRMRLEGPRRSDAVAMGAIRGFRATTVSHRSRHRRRNWRDIHRTAVGKGCAEARACLPSHPYRSIRSALAGLLMRQKRCPSYAVAHVRQHRALCGWWPPSRHTACRRAATPLHRLHLRLCPGAHARPYAPPYSDPETPRAVTRPRWRWGPRTRRGRTCGRPRPAPP